MSLRSNLVRLASTLPKGDKTRREILSALKSAYRPDGSWAEDPRAPKTIWGPAQTMFIIDRGVRWFSTAGHGGLAIADGVARKMLTPAAYRFGERWGGYLWYEEDVTYTIPFYEHPEWSVTLSQKAGGSVGSKEQLEKTLRNYFPEYFAELEKGGVHPTKPKIGDKIVFNREVQFGGGTVVPKGTVGVVFKVTGSMFYLDIPVNPYRVRLSFQSIMSAHGALSLTP
jgi:hypothetical protein